MQTSAMYVYTRPQRPMIRRALLRIFGAGIILFLCFAIVLRFVLPHGSHAIQWFGFGFCGSMGASVAMFRQPFGQVVRRLALVQFVLAVMTVALAWLFHA